jgi:hypothetical protein
VIAALIGFAGVLGGLVVGSGFRFWIDRRSEITDALEAASLLGSTLRRADAEADAVGAQGLEIAWQRNRTALIRHMPPRTFQAYEAHWRTRIHDEAPHERLLAATDGLTELFWQEHEAFILVPLVNVLRGNMVSKRLEAVVTERLRLPAAR